MEERNQLTLNGKYGEELGKQIQLLGLSHYIAFFIDCGEFVLEIHPMRI